MWALSPKVVKILKNDVRGWGQTLVGGDGVAVEDGERRKRVDHAKPVVHLVRQRVSSQVCRRGDTVSVRAEMLNAMRLVFLSIDLSNYIYLSIDPSIYRRHTRSAPG